MTTYTLDPGKAVHVAFDITITNQRPNQVEANGVRTFYLPNFSVPGAGGGRRAPRHEEQRDHPAGVRRAHREPPVLLRGRGPATRPLLPAVPDVPPHLRPPSAGAPVRVASRGSTRPTPRSLVAIGDPGLTAVEIVGAGRLRGGAGGRRHAGVGAGRAAGVHRRRRIDDPDEWIVKVSARDDTKLIERVVDVGEQDVNVLGWPDDPEWADFAATQVEDGVPALEELTGLDWPATDTLDVVETASPYLYGYAGWYMPRRRSDRDRRRARPAGDPPRAGPPLVQRQPVQRPLDQRGLRRPVRGAGDGGGWARSSRNRRRSKRATPAG